MSFGPFAVAPQPPKGEEKEGPLPIGLVRPFVMLRNSQHPWAERQNKTGQGAYWQKKFSVETSDELAATPARHIR
jgi:hypothetical protein